MNPQEMVVIIVARAILGGVLRARIAAGRRHDVPLPARDDTERLAHEVQQLKERIQVLERVITDTRSSVDLDREIERLRDR